MEEYFTIQEVAGVLKVPAFQVYNLANSKLLKAFKVGKHWRIPKTGLEEYISKQIKLNNL